MNRKRNMRMNNEPLAINFLEAIGDAHVVIDLLASLERSAYMDAADESDITARCYIDLTDVGFDRSREPAEGILPVFAVGLGPVVLARWMHVKDDETVVRNTQLHERVHVFG